MRILDASRIDTAVNIAPPLSAASPRTLSYPISCSKATVLSSASVVARLNELRFAAGKPALGFLNPLFYQNPAAFNDVTSGVNCGTGGCGKGHGFPAVAGWDPATGLGTPNYAALAKIVA